MNGDCEGCKVYCKEHELEIHGPLSFFNVGNEFENDKYKVVFVGKTHWYNSEEVKKLKFFPDSIFRDCRNDCLEMFKTYSSRSFWGQLRSITKKLYPNFKSIEELLQKIAITNLTKCNTSKGFRDTTPYALTERCIELFEKEIKILNPKHLIFFTGADYDNYLLRLNFGFQNHPLEKTSQTSRREIGNSSPLWWEREYSDSKRSMKVLRTRHPVIAPRGFPDEIVGWVKEVPNTFTL